MFTTERFNLRALLRALGVVLLAALPVAAQENADCLGCHEDPELMGSRNGRPMSVFVDASQLEASVHGPMDCVLCHADLAGTDGLHAAEVAPVRCATCHEDEATPFASSDRIHGPGRAAKGLIDAATCASCHTGHDVQPSDEPQSSTSRERVAETCGACHTRLPEVHAQVMAPELWEQTPRVIPSCADCHASHDARPAQPGGLANADCMECHARTDLDAGDGPARPGLHVAAEAYAGSMHAGIACAECHADVRASPTRPCETATHEVNCAVCHAAVVDEYAASIHGVLSAQGVSDAPRCLDCHDVHAAAPHTQPDSPLFVRRIPALCATCHREGEKASRRLEAEAGTGRAPADIVGGYTESIHGKALMDSGLVVAATCVSCHTAHSMQAPSDPRSSIAPDHVAATCGACHQGIEEQYHAGVHWRGNTETDSRLPTCNDCHTAHTIGRTDGTNFRMAVTESCGNCHAEQAETFLETLHGKATLLGSSVAAKCYDCHGTHAILPPSNPASTLGSSHIVNTCSQCHEGAHVAFTGYLTHATPHDREHYPWLFWTFWAMTLLLVGTLVVALAHSAAWLVKLLRTRKEWQAGKAAMRSTREGWFFRRFSRQQRIQHMVMMLAFFDLAVTGMALKFSAARWAGAIAPVLGGPDAMRVLHRIGALALISIFCVHLLDLISKRRSWKRSWLAMLTAPDTLMFGRRDWNDLRGMLRWFVGRGPRPRFERYTYWEKFDYFAVFWGVAVIGLTGLMLWFPEAATHVVPGWFLNVATIVHSDEALLAVVFIFTIHFFNSHLRPDKWPMDMVMFTGRMPLEELRHDKPLEYERLLASGELQKHLTGPFPPELERAFRVFGFLALGLGIAIVIVIVSALLGGAG